MSRVHEPDEGVKEPWFVTAVKVIFAALGLGALAVWIQQWVHHWRSRRQRPPLAGIDFKLSHQGLSTSQVEARRTDEVLQARLAADNKAKKERWQKNTFSVFNITILVLAISQVLLRDPLGALATIGTLILSISVNIFQEARAAKQVEALANRARPMAAAIRDGRLQSIDQDDMVVGEVLVAGKGDEILADGAVLESKNFSVVDSTRATDEESALKAAGDALSAGTYCRTGWAVYQVSRLNIQQPEPEITSKIVTSIRNKTPLQTIIERVLYVLLGIVAIFYVVFFLEVVRIEIFPPDLMAAYREVMSVIFSILPSGLLLMIVINYAVGSADIARSDVLVHNSQTIESLAQVSTVGFIRHGGAMGLTVDLDMMPISDESLKISERRITQALANYVHSIPGDQYLLSIIKEQFDGEPRAIHQQARYLSLYGWEAMTFSSADMPGSFVIGYPEALKPYLKLPDKSEPEGDVIEETENGGKGLASQLRKLFRKNKKGQENGEGEGHNSASNMADKRNLTEIDNGRQELTENTNEGQNQSDEGGVFKKFRQRLSSVFQRKEKDETPIKADGPEKIRRMMFAYSPLQQALYADDFYPQCPQNLIPLCTIKFINEVRPEIMQAVKIFKDEDIAIKLLTGNEPANSLKLANELGIIEKTAEDSAVMLGEEITGPVQEELQQAVKKTTVFAQSNSDQMVQFIQALQAGGEHVAVFGASINDLRIMKAANLSITRKGSSPSLLDQADIIVLQNTMNALPDALQKGQRIVNSVLDVLKLNLTRIAYTLILLVVMYLAGERTFFYHPAQGGMISFFTIILPSVALSFWASNKTVDGKNLSRLLFHFVTPTAFVSALAVLMIYLFFKGSGAGVAYIQLAVTHLLVLIGLALVVFAQPPVHFLVAGDDYSGRWEPTWAALGFYILFHILTLLRPAQRWLMLAPLRSLQDYLLVLVVALGWAILLFGVWRLLWPDRFRPSRPKPSEELVGEIQNTSE